MQKLEFELKPSLFYLSALMIVMLLCAGVLISLPIDGLLKIPLMTMLLAYGSYLIWHFGLLRSRHSVISIKRDVNGRWLLQTPTKIYHADLCHDSTVTGWVTVLRFQLRDHFWQKSCLILRDSLPADEYRRLVVMIRKW